jgi:tetratricopeptide (TPR) repeat protein
MIAEEWLKEGDKLFDLGEFEKALEAYDRISEFHPKYADACYRKGTILLKLSRYKDAVKAYQIVLWRNPGSARAWNYKGFALDEQGKYEEALKAYDNATKIDPGYFEAWYNKGIVFDNLGRYPKALRAYQRALKISPKDADACYGMASILDELGRYERSLEAYDKVIELNAKHAGAWNNKGVTFDKLARYQQAREAFEVAIGIDPKDALLRVNLGGVLFKLLDLKGAAQKVKDALDTNPLQPDAFGLLGKIKIEERDYAGAAEAFRKAIPLDADNPWLLLWLAYAEYLNAEFSLRSMEKENGGDECIPDRSEAKTGYEINLDCSKSGKKKNVRRMREADNTYQEKMLLIMRGLERAENLCEKRGKQHRETRAYILYLLSCFYHKNRDIFACKEKLQQCIALKSSIRSPARELLRKVWSFQVRPSWWHWWFGSPQYPWAKRILFGVIGLLILGLLVLHPFIKDWLRPLELDSVLYALLVVLLLLVLLSPRIERIKAKDVEIQLRAPAAVEFVLSPARMEEN